MKKPHAANSRNTAANDRSATPPIPTRQQPLRATAIDDAFDWLDADLARLEDHFRAFWTPRSVRGALGR